MLPSRTLTPPLAATGYTGCSYRHTRCGQTQCGHASPHPLPPRAAARQSRGWECPLRLRAPNGGPLRHPPPGNPARHHRSIRSHSHPHSRSHSSCRRRCHSRRRWGMPPRPHSVQRRPPPSPIPTRTVPVPPARHPTCAAAPPTDRASTCTTVPCGIGPADTAGTAPEAGWPGRHPSAPGACPPWSLGPEPRHPAGSARRVCCAAAERRAAGRRREPGARESSWAGSAPPSTGWRTSPSPERPSCLQTDKGLAGPRAATERRRMQWPPS
mmetsp:Transcript_2250/g.7349  ORF Transcript_2250/g.7349 Transcript_2250/m.7349 type:complete len:269 (+) Transcript_2250:273-1079(+)